MAATPWRPSWRPARLFRCSISPADQSNSKKPPDAQSSGGFELCPAKKDQGIWEETNLSVSADLRCPGGDTNLDLAIHWRPNRLRLFIDLKAGRHAHAFELVILQGG